MKISKKKIKIPFVVTSQNCYIARKHSLVLSGLNTDILQSMWSKFLKKFHTFSMVRCAKKNFTFILLFAIEMSVLSGLEFKKKGLSPLGVKGTIG